MTSRRFTITNGTVHDRKRAVRDPESGRMVMVDPRGGRIRARGGAPLDPILKRALDESRANRSAPISWDEECPF